MSAAPSSPLVERVLSGEDPDLARLAAQGMLPLPPDELVALQVALAGGAAGEDRDLALLARASLAELTPERVAGIIAEEPRPEVLRHFALERPEPAVLEAVLRTRNVSYSLLAEVAPSLPPKLQERLLVRQDAIVRHPEILDALARNPELSTYSRRRIAEIREHLLPSERPADEGDEEDEEGAPSQQELEEAIEEARSREAPPAGQPEKAEKEETTGLTNAQIRTLPVPVRRKLARTSSSKSLRDVLMRDPNPQVALAALSGAQMTEGDVEKLASSRSVARELLEEIARRRDWTNKYKIVHALVHNPRTPAGVAVRLLPRVSVRALGLLARDRNVSNAVRSNAQRLYRMKRR